MSVTARRISAGFLIVVLLALGSCSSGPEASDGPDPAETQSESGSGSTAHDIWALEPLSDLDPGTYFLDPDLDPSTPLRVVYEVPFEGWSVWIGAGKFADEEAVCSSNGCLGHPAHVSLSITTVSNLVSHGCRNHSWAVPTVGPSVEDLATALTDLAPFRVTTPPEDVSIYGYHGKHLVWKVPNLPLSDEGDFSGCAEGTLKSWVAAIDAGEEGDAFYGYTGPGYREEFWILDVEGTRLLIAAERSAGSPPDDLAELRAILDSIQIEP